MAWTKPTISEISVGLEINSYACAGEVIKRYLRKYLKEPGKIVGFFL